MNELIVLEIISITSLLFSIYSNIFNFTNLNSYFLLFVWTVIISGIYGIIQFKAHNDRSRLVLLSLLLPMAIFKSKSSIYFIILLTFSLYLYLTRRLNSGDYNNYADSFRNSFFIIIGLLIFSFIGDLTYRFTDFSIPFLIIYFLSTIILIRNLRYMHVGMEKEDMRRLNIRYLIFLSITSIFIGIEGLRSFLFNILNSIYNLIIEILIAIFYYPLSLIILALDKFFNWILSIISTGMDMEDEIVAPTMEEVESIVYQVKEHPILDIVFKIVLLIIILYIGYRLFKNRQEVKKYSPDYIEEREFIRRDEYVKHRRFGFRRPKGYKEQIRFYYRKYLNKLLNKDIKIEKYYTTEDINELGKERFSHNIVEKIREIYLKVRYGNDEGNSDEVEEIKNLYRDLK